MARCVVCDYCSTAPSLFGAPSRKGVKLVWSDREGGYVCSGSCGGPDLDAMEPYLREELVEIVEIPPEMSARRM